MLSEYSIEYHLSEDLPKPSQRTLYCQTGVAERDGGACSGAVGPDSEGNEPASTSIDESSTGGGGSWSSTVWQPSASLSLDVGDARQGVVSTCSSIGVTNTLGAAPAAGDERAEVWELLRSASSVGLEGWDASPWSSAQSTVCPEASARPRAGGCAALLPSHHEII